MGKAEERCRADRIELCEKSLIWFDFTADGGLSGLLSAVFLLPWKGLRKIAEIGESPFYGTTNVDNKRWKGTMGINQGGMIKL